MGVIKFSLGFLHNEAHNTEDNCPSSHNIFSFYLFQLFDFVIRFLIPRIREYHICLPLLNRVKPYQGLIDDSAVP